MIGGHRVFDAHVHMQPWSMLKPAVRAVMEQGRVDTAEVLRFQSDAAAFETFLSSEGIDRAVLVNYVSPDVMGFPPAVNDWVAAYARGHDHLIAMGSVHPRATPDMRAEVERLVGLGIRALKVHPAHQLLYPNAYDHGEPAMRDLYAAAAEHGLPVTIHTGTSVFPGAKNRFTDPIHVDDVAVDFPDVTFLVAHAGRPLWHETAFFLARRHDNVMLELSGIPPKRLLESLPRLGEITHKCIWGSDWPSPGVRSMRGNVEAFLATAGLSDSQKGAILWDNAARIFRV